MKRFNVTGVCIPEKHYMVDLGVTFGFIKEKDGMVTIGNRIFETKLYDLFLSEMVMDDALGQFVSVERNQYIVDGMLQMRLVMEKFYHHFTKYMVTATRNLTGYLLSFNFSKNKTAGIREIVCDERRILEVTV